MCDIIVNNPIDEQLQKKIMDNKIVTVGVITYNSANTVLETLNSIKSQSYHSIELLISDDHSCDETVSLCKEWLRLNDNRFTYATILESDTNKGVPNNCNKVVDNAQGNWIKIIAGDDTLDSKCIENNMTFVSNNSSVNILFSKSRNFNSVTFETVGYRPSGHFILPESAEEQLELFLIKDFVNPTTVFCKKSLYQILGGYDEQYRAMEDSPMWYKVLKHGFSFHYMDTVTVNYRISANSLSNSKRRGKPNLFWLDSKRRFFIDKIKPELVNRGYKMYAILQDENYKLMKCLSESKNPLYYYFVKVCLKVNSILMNKAIHRS